jgi:hypothetical protein
MNEIGVINELHKLFNDNAEKKLTIISIGEFGFVSLSKIKIHSAELSKFAQYNNALKIIYTPIKKRTKYQKFLYNYKLTDLIIYEGWHDIDVNTSYKQGEFMVTECFSGEALPSIVEKCSLTPLYNGLKKN